MPRSIGYASANFVASAFKFRFGTGKFLALAPGRTVDFALSRPILCALPGKSTFFIDLQAIPRGLDIGAFGFDDSSASPEKHRRRQCVSDKAHHKTERDTGHNPELRSKGARQ